VNSEAFITWLLDHGADPNAYFWKLAEALCPRYRRRQIDNRNRLSFDQPWSHGRRNAVLQAAVDRRDGKMTPMLDHLLSLEADIEHRQKHPSIAFTHFQVSFDLESLCWQKEESLVKAFVFVRPGTANRLR
jgi:hypothetical protein